MKSFLGSALRGALIAQLIVHLSLKELMYQYLNNAL